MEQLTYSLERIKCSGITLDSLLRIVRVEDDNFLITSEGHLIITLDNYTIACEPEEFVVLHQ